MLVAEGWLSVAVMVSLIDHPPPPPCDGPDIIGLDMIGPD